MTTASCHYGARAIELSGEVNRKLLLLAVVAFNLAILFVFKYYGLFAQSINTISGSQISTDLGFLLPVGISFYTFQAIGYVADVYCGKVAAERSLPRTTLFVAFFPQLVAGPIERASRLLFALRKPIHFRWRNIRSGCWLILWGLFKKIVIADRLAVLVDLAYESPEQSTNGILLLATYAFAFQIYCDFSGYTDMAIGSAKIFGIDLMQNFRTPYLAHSLRNFWGRWHISLSTWFRDYLYIPLGGNRTSQLRWAANMLFVFAVSGLWHGAKWTYVIWGAIHGMCVLVEFACTKNLRVLKQGKSTGLKRTTLLTIQIVVTFHVVLIAWIFFRAESLSDAWYVLSSIPHANPTLSFDLPVEFSRFEMAVAALALCWMSLIEFPYRGDTRRLLGLRPRILCRFAVIVTVLLVVNFGIFSNPAQFVYFQF